MFTFYYGSNHILYYDSNTKMSNNETIKNTTRLVIFKCHVSNLLKWKYHSIDATSAYEELSFANLNIIQSIIPKDQKNKTTQWCSLTSDWIKPLVASGVGLFHKLSIYVHVTLRVLHISGGKVKQLTRPR